MSDSSEGPPDPHVLTTAANQLEHPLWAAARGGGRGAGRGRGRGRASAITAAPSCDTRFGALNVFALELQTGSRSLEGIGQHDVDDHGPLSENEDEDFADKEQMHACVGNEDDEEDVWEDGCRQKQHGKRRSQNAFTGAAFGVGKPKHRRTDDDDGSASMASRSQTSTARQREMEKRIFPVSGLRCLCCSLAHRLAPVEQWITENACRLEEEALFKFGTLVWKEKVKGPVEAEGASVPDISWEQLRNHFLLHTANATLQRAGIVKHLAGMRAKIGERLVRYDDTNPADTGEIDKASATLWMQVLDKESKERSLLFPTTSAALSRRAVGAPASED